MSSTPVADLIDKHNAARKRIAELEAQLAECQQNNVNLSDAGSILDRELLDMFTTASKTKERFISVNCEQLRAAIKAYFACQRERDALLKQIEDGSLVRF